MSVTFYRTLTDINNPRFGISLGARGNDFLPLHLHSINSIPNDHAPNFANATILKLIPPSANLVPECLYAKRNSYSARNKPIEIDRIPDIWTVLNTIVSERFIKAAGDDISSSGTCYPITLYDKATETPFQRRFFAFYCMTVIRTKHDDVSTQSFACDSKTIYDEEKISLHAIASNKSLQNYLEKIPMWVLWGYPGVIYFSERFFEKLSKASISGLTELTKDRFNGDVSHVWCFPRPNQHG